jgi:hypothetical protein
MLNLTKRGLFVVILVVMALAAVACDGPAPLLFVQNSTSDAISINISYKEVTRALRVKKQGIGLFSDSLIIPSMENPQVLIDAFERYQYMFVVKDTDGNELFQRTFLNEELDDCDWEILTTPEGIQ